MSPQLRKTIQDFLSDYCYFGGNHPDNEQHPFLKIAIDLLQQAIVEDYKIPEDYSWAGLRNGVVVELSRDSLSLHHDHIDEIIPIRLQQ